ncbi:MAG: metalloenzyme [Anaerolineae bacterium]
MRILFFFLDGVGLGEDDPDHNPFAAAHLPTLTQFTGGRRWLNDLPRIDSERGVFIPTDANLGVPDRPQSASGQAAILTGVNVPQALGYHYGPKPNPEIRAILERESVVRKLAGRGHSAALLNVYPSGYIEAIERGVRLRSSNQHALHVAGVPMLDGQAYLDQRGLSVDFTGEIWREHGSKHDAATRVWRTRFSEQDFPLLTPHESGRLMASLAAGQDFSFFDCWLTDYVGHRGDLQQAVALLERLDAVLAGLLEAWDDSQGLIVITSDHGNIEDLSQRGHTRNLVPTLVIGAARQTFTRDLTDLTGFAPAILSALNGGQPASTRHASSPRY